MSKKLFDSLQPISIPTEPLKPKTQDGLTVFGSRAKIVSPAADTMLLRSLDRTTCLLSLVSLSWWKRSIWRKSKPFVTKLWSNRARNSTSHLIVLRKNRSLWCVCDNCEYIPRHMMIHIFKVNNGRPSSRWSSITMGVFPHHLRFLHHPALPLLLQPLQCLHHY